MASGVCKQVYIITASFDVVGTDRCCGSCYALSEYCSTNQRNSVAVFAQHVVHLGNFLQFFVCFVSKAFL